MMEGRIEKDQDGDEIIVYDINGVLLQVDVSELAYPSTVHAMADDLKEAARKFWSNENDDWTCCMTPDEADVFIEDELMILSKYRPASC